MAPRVAGFRDGLGWGQWVFGVGLGAGGLVGVGVGLGVGDSRQRGLGQGLAQRGMVAKVCRPAGVSHLGFAPIDDFYR